MTDVPAELKYTKSHEWVSLQDDGTVTIGITAHAQDQLGDMVFVEVPEVGSELAEGDACAVVESVKAASDVYAPLAGEVIAANEDLADSPESVNQDPYGAGWILRMKPQNAAAIDGLMSADDYQAMVEAESH